MTSNKKCLTVCEKRAVGVPITKKEQLDKLRLKNPAIDKLIDKFGLETNL